MSNSPKERRSFAQRRELFKDIWNATMLFDDEDSTDVTVKPKVVKTLRLEHSNNEKPSARKKRLKNLRTVCNKILAFCDRQEKDDHYYHEIVSSGKNVQNDQLRKTTKRKKKKIVKKVKKSLYSPKENALINATDSERKDRNIGDTAIPVNKIKTRVQRAVPKAVPMAVPTVSSQIRSKLTGTKSPMRHNSSPIPDSHKKNINKKNSARKKKSTGI